jgi:hypothetical protein
MNLTGSLIAAQAFGPDMDKFTRNCSYARSPVAPELRDQLIALIADVA